MNFKPIILSQKMNRRDSNFLKTIKSVVSLFGLMIAFMVSQPDWVAAQETGSVLIENGTVITIAGENLANTDVLVEDGIITEIGENLDVPRGVDRIDATDKFVMPGIIVHILTSTV